MQRFSTWAGWIAAILAVVLFIVKEVIVPIVVDYIKKQPETGNAIQVALKSLINIVQHTWFSFGFWMLVAFAAGLWVDWLLRKLDGSRAEKRKELGYDML